MFQFHSYWLQNPSTINRQSSQSELDTHWLQLKICFMYFFWQEIQGVVNVTLCLFWEQFLSLMGNLLLV